MFLSRAKVTKIKSEKHMNNIRTYSYFSFFDTNFVYSGINQRTEALYLFFFIIIPNTRTEFYIFSSLIKVLTIKREKFILGKTKAQAGIGLSMQKYSVYSETLQNHLFPQLNNKKLFISVIDCTSG